MRTSAIKPAYVIIIILQEEEEEEEVFITNRQLERQGQRPFGLRRHRPASDAGREKPPPLRTAPLCPVLCSPLVADRKVGCRLTPDFLARDLEIFGQDGCQVTLLLGGASLSRVKPVVFFP